MPNAALAISNLSKSFSGNTVVHDLSFDIKEGEVFGLLGPNGAGKSTTINIIGGVAYPDSGSVSVFGHDNQKDYRITRRLLGVMHQEIVIDSFFPIGKALKFHSGFYGVPYDKPWVETLIDELQLRPHLDKPMIKLSGGLKRRFMIAKALSHRPRLLILDEPTAGVDIELRHSLWEFVRRINQLGTSILLTTHYLEEAEEMCERIAIMHEGNLVALEQKDTLINQFSKRQVNISLASSLPESIVLPETPTTALSLDRTRVTVNLCPGDNIHDILSLLIGQGGIIESVHEEQNRLEDVFLELTGGSNEKRNRMNTTLGGAV